MTTYYSVLRPVTKADLDAAPGIVEVLKMIPSDGTVTFEQFRHLKNGRAGRGLRTRVPSGCSRGCRRTSASWDWTRFDSGARSSTSRASRT